MNRLATFAIFALLSPPALAQPPEAAEQPPAVPEQPPPATPTQAETARKDETAAPDTSKRLDELEASVDDLDSSVREANRTAQAASPGTTHFLASGYGFAGFRSSLDGDGASFSAGFSPILLWKLTDRILFEGEVEFELEDDHTEVGLEYAHGAWVVSDWFTFGAGLFLSPINVFAERLHPAWINKLPDAPLPFGHDGLLPTSELGVQGRGVFSVGRTARLTYAVALSNGPVINDVSEEPEEAGMLKFNNFADSNRDKAVGGRVAIVLPPFFELGVAAETADVGIEDSELEHLRAILGAADIGLIADSAIIKGTLEARAQVVYTRVPRADFNGVSFNNRRSGGYAQLAYRFSRVDPIKPLELVARLDWLRGPNVPENMDETRGTAGIDWWTTPSTVFKAALQRSWPAEGESTNAVMLQAALGL